jgi:hypothetical protein
MPCCTPCCMGHFPWTMLTQLSGGVKAECDRASHIDLRMSERISELKDEVRPNLLGRGCDWCLEMACTSARQPADAHSKEPMVLCATLASVEVTCHMVKLDKRLRAAVSSDPKASSLFDVAEMGWKSDGALLMRRPRSVGGCSDCDWPRCQTWPPARPSLQVVSSLSRHRHASPSRSSSALREHAPRQSARRVPSRTKCVHALTRACIQMCSPVSL